MDWLKEHLQETIVLPKHTEFLKIFPLKHQKFWDRDLSTKNSSFRVC